MYILITLLLLTYEPNHLTANPVKDKMALEQRVVQWVDLMINPTGAGLDDMLDDNLSYGHSGGHIDTKTSLQQSLLSGASDFVEIKVTDQQIAIVGKTAIVRHNIDCKTMDRGAPGNPNLKVLLVWVKEKGGWKLLGRQAVKNI
ncbi:MAG: nuclear transport factor 2 family protein [Saprospiraceae bacterium]|nr:nuclear transport factor 2 family protein [Saprospiraceae bacterium]MBK8514264.1 nuclear transport factor 2 family protein [Saprospiraceae bacterium]MBK8776855.1 nuclear transport factor 2 family protein [Saprospiraceae bacterium]MBL0112312.1 nuclear transport factor 2 family protein [Saprospiraceae bacterium]MBP7801558.1 nuclear transport factor 2 family protein [Saprospiraceae bacterium]